MALNGIRPSPYGQVQSPTLPRPGVEPGLPQPRPARGDVVDLPGIGTRSTAPMGDAPAGTDPEIWNVLTEGERSYFARLSLAGPLTYGRSSGPTNTPVFRGTRLDVRI